MAQPPSEPARAPRPLRLPAASGVLRWWAAHGPGAWSRASAFRSLARRANGTPGRVTTRAGLAMDIVIGDPVDTALAVDGEFEPGLSRRLTELASRAECVIDVGCNIGYFTCLAASAAPEGARVLAIDANPAMIARCEANLRANGLSAITEHVGLGAKPGRMALRFAPDRPSQGSFAPPSASNAITVEVPVTTLSEVIARHGIGRVDLLKVDIEGFEPALFDGLSADHAGRIDHIVFEYEVAHLARAGFSPQDIWKHSWWQGFELLAFSSRNGATQPFGESPPHGFDSVWARRRGLA